ncbi:MAG: hypothetical protein Q8M76_18185 [Spirochaetaceae bacterium]|nr:hypothetical protein [Spirochaetaceae bacterium]
MARPGFGLILIEGSFGGDMADLRVKFLKVLKAELEDLIEDFAVVERKASERLRLSEITDYVFRENDMIFRREGEAVREIIKLIDGLDISLYKSCDDLAASLGPQIARFVETHEDPETVYSFFMRKLGKVRAYIDSAD